MLPTLSYFFGRRHRELVVARRAVATTIDENDGRPALLYSVVGEFRFLFFEPYFRSKTIHSAPNAKYAARVFIDGPLLFHTVRFEMCVCVFIYKHARIIDYPGYYATATCRIMYIHIVVAVLPRQL